MTSTRRAVAKCPCSTGELWNLAYKNSRMQTNFVNQIIEKVGGNTGDANAVIILFNYNASVAEGKEAGSNGTRMNSFKR